MDSLNRPDCATARGVPLGTVSAKQPPTTRKGVWRVTATPVTVLGRFSGRMVEVRATYAAPSKPDRSAESMSTVEVDHFDPAGAATSASIKPLTTRNEVFGLLPWLATAAPGAVVRTARLFTGVNSPNGFAYGAQVRDANISADERAAVLSESRRLRVPVLIVASAAQVLAAPCPAQQPGAKPADSGEVAVTQASVSTSRVPSWAQNLNRWPSTPTDCDEPTQVLVVRRSIVGPITHSDLGTDGGAGVDVVIDATLRLTRP